MMVPNSRHSVIILSLVLVVETELGTWGGRRELSDRIFGRKIWHQREARVPRPAQRAHAAGAWRPRDAVWQDPSLTQRTVGYYRYSTVTYCNCVVAVPWAILTSTYVRPMLLRRLTYLSYLRRPRHKTSEHEQVRALFIPSFVLRFSDYSVRFFLSEVSLDLLEYAARHASLRASSVFRDWRRWLSSSFQSANIHQSLNSSIHSDNPRHEVIKTVSPWSPHL